MATVEGPLVLADISGYTRFIAETELEHSDVVVRRMLNPFLARRQCSCDACSKAPELTLKMIAHFGRYSRQRVGETGQVHGVDVIVPHRLAKNSVPSRDY